MTAAFAGAVGQALSGPGPHPPDLLAFAIDSAEILIELSSCVHVSVMRPCFPDLARLALSFAGVMRPGVDDAEQVDAVRRLCLELAITIAEVNPPLCRRMTFESDAPGAQTQVRVCEERSDARRRTTTWALPPPPRFLTS